MSEQTEAVIESLGDGIYLVDAFYLDRPAFTGCYIMEDHGEVAIIETNTNRAVPIIVAALEQLGLKKEQVKSIILTHIHLDHAGGAGQLMQLCPGAQLILHPRGKKHMADPEKLISSAREVYGQQKFDALYGQILPIPKERIRAVDEGESQKIGERELLFLETPGHAKHHIIVFDDKSRAVFSGDAFGLAYPRFIFAGFRLVFPSTSPVQFEPERSIETYGKIVDLKPTAILFTHFGRLDDIPAAYDEVCGWIDYSVEAAQKRFAEGRWDDELVDVLREDVRAYFEEKFRKGRGGGMSREEEDFLFLDIDLNAKGLAHYINKVNS
jgi:glyoxylase-like metal-dependent hydrolase (beta-lactamase superfamily II)